MATWPGTVMPVLLVSAKSKGARGGAILGYQIIQILPPPPVPPSIVYVVPTPGTPILRSDPLYFDAQDVTGQFRRVIVKVEFPATGVWEMAYDGDSFSPAYTGSLAEPTLLGYHFTLRRGGGWTSSPKVTVFAVNTGGAENA